MENKFWVGWLVIREEKKRMAVPVFARILSHCLSFFFFFSFLETEDDDSTETAGKSEASRLATIIVQDPV